MRLPGLVEIQMAAISHNLELVRALTNLKIIGFIFGGFNYNTGVLIIYDLFFFRNYIPRCEKENRQRHDVAFQ